MSWWRRRTLRSRLLLIGVVGLCVGLLSGGLALVAALGYVLQRSVDSEVMRTASDVAALVDAGAVPQPVPAAGSDQVQVVDNAGRVRAASLDADRLVPMLHPDEIEDARAGRPLFIDGDRLGLSGPVRVVALPAGPANDRQTVLVGRSMADVLKGVHLFRTVLLIGFPVLVLALAMVAWRVISATLAPVETLRRGAEEITGATRSGRLPVPPGEDEIHSLAVTLNGMLDRLESARNRQREFVADAAHELRSPLANMRTQLEVAQRLGPAADWPAVGEDLLTDTQRLARLVDDLLLLARTDESSRVARPVPVDLAALLTEIATRYPTVTLTLPDEPLWTSGDPDALLRVVANLLDNAVRYAATSVSLSASAAPTTTGSALPPAAGPATSGVAGGPTGSTVPGAGAVSTAGGSTNRVVLVVTDDGPGIPVADRERVFERFTRLDDARARDAGGSGLGLAIVRELVRRHGGTVRLTDATAADDAGTGAGVGLRVEVELPGT